MGLFNKLKNALFEEEEIDLEPEMDKVVIKDEEPVAPKKVEEPKKEIPLENERELFKAENTFNFPDFDEEEFVTNYEPPKIKEKIEKRKPVYERPKANEYERKSTLSRETTSRRDRLEKKMPDTPKKFKPSPVISPVYGILDKNYKKEDIVMAAKTIKPKEKPVIDVDLVRKKAFGTLEDDIEKTINSGTEEFYSKDTKSIDELLNASVDDTIEIKYEESYEEPYESTYEEPVTEYEDIPTTIEEELDKVDENLEVIDEKKQPVEHDEKYLEENTLESDLFDLIDSMYDNREDEDK